MSYIVKEEPSFKQIAVGAYPARCVRIIGLGTQHGEYEGKPNKAIKVIISWELPTELIAEGEYSGQPYMVSKFYTQSLGEKSNLRKHLASWRGRDFTKEELEGFDLSNIASKVCLVSVIHNVKGKAKVDSIMALPKGITVPPQVNPTIIFNIFQWDQEIFDSLTDGIKDIIRKSDEYTYMNKSGFPLNDESDQVAGEEVVF